jgi:pilus assembly protein CpaC
MQKIRIDTPVCMRTLFVLVFSICFGSMVACADDVVVLKGSSARIPVPEGIKKITVANPLVIDARPSDDGTSVLVNGLAEGNSELRIQKLQGADLVDNVIVRDNLNETMAEIKELLSDVEGLDIKILGNKIVFKGNLLTKSDYDKVGRVVAAYPMVVLNMSKFDRAEMNKYVEEAILKDIGLDTVTARVMEDMVVLEGVVYSNGDKVRAEEMAKLRMPNVKNLLRVQEVMIETDVQFVQLSGDKGHNFGMNVLDTLSLSASGSGTGGTGSRGRIPVTFGISAGGSARFVADLTKGNNKIVDSTHLSTKSGETGSFQSGGTSYIKVSGTTSGDLKSVDYGVILKVKPTLQGRDQILNEVSIEVSIPVTDDQGNFAIQRYDTACTSLCKVGESMVVSGNTQQFKNNTRSKTPLLGDVPLINLFFSSNLTKNHQEEFVIVVTPRPIFPSAATGAPFGEQHKQLLQDKDKTTKD